MQELERCLSIWRNTTTRLLGGLLLCVLTLIAAVPVVGCTQAQKVSVAQEIVNWTPAFISAADAANAIIQSLDPATVIILRPMTVAIDAFAPQIALGARNYLANPNQTTLQVVQALIVQIQQNTNAALLNAAKITNPDSQARALASINLVATIANTLLALIQQISTKAQVLAMAAGVHVTLAQVRPYMDQPGLQRASLQVSHDLALTQAPTVDQFFAFEARSGF